ncbi:General substrate transporter [Nannochloropsis gaditana]|uniref:General substrate transporter n=1 Tax=Nannochloropsis gaditana TaxID=72520 RepID=W7T0J9_9STRA|nr:General substrate transporter [Nannochloropsis gaditana]
MRALPTRVLPSGGGTDGKGRLEGLGLARGLHLVQDHAVGAVLRHQCVMYFAPVIFKKFLASEMAILATLAVALLNYLSTFLALYLVDRAGCRLLLVCGGLGMALFTALFALFTSAAFDYQNDKRLAGVIIACTALYVMNFAYSIRQSVYILSFLAAIWSALQVGTTSLGRLGRDLPPAPSGQMHDYHHACQLADEVLHRNSRACNDPPGKVSNCQANDF